MRALKKISLCLALLLAMAFCLPVGAEIALLPTESPPATEEAPEITPEPTATVELEVTPEVTATVEPEIAPEPATMEPETTPEPTETLEPETTPEPTETIEPETTPETTETIEPETTPETMTTVEPEITPEPTATVEPETTPEPTATIAPTETPAETEMPPEPTLEPEDQSAVDLPEETPPAMKRVRNNAQIGWRGAVPSDEPGLPVPRLFQGDYDEIVLYYNGTPRSVATSGCGATSVSMVLAYLTGNTEQNPYLLFCAAVDAGRYHGNGLSHDTLIWLAEQYGVTGRWTGSESAVLDALESGRPVIAHMGEGAFTEKGHYIVLRGRTEGGKILVNDPASPERSRMAFPMETLRAQTRTSDAFLILTLAEPEATPEPEIEAPESEIEAPEPEMATPEPIASDAPSEDARCDVNQSGAVDLCDAQLVYDIAMQPEGAELSEEMRRRADVNGDGSVDAMDIQCVLACIRSENKGG